MKSRPPACRLLEPLEHRSLLATVFWDGGAGDGLWHSPANWSGDVVPGAADDVIISVPGTAIVRFTTGTATVRTVRSREDLRVTGGSLGASVNVRVEAGVTTVSGGTLRVPAKLEVLAAGEFRLESGRVEGAGTARVWGAMAWSGGTLAGTGVAYIEDDASLTIDGNEVVLERRLVNRGDLRWTGLLWSIASGYFRNDPSGVVTVVHESATPVTPRIAAPDGATRFFQYGRMAFNLPPLYAGVNAPRRAEVAVRTVTFADSTVHALAGTPHFSRGGVHMGHFELASMGALAFSGDTWFTTSASFHGPMEATQILFEAGAHTIKKARDWGRIAVSLFDGAFIHFAEQQQMDTLLIQHGVVAGPGDVVVRDFFSWVGGSMIGAGRTFVLEGSSAHISTLTGPAGPTLRLKRDLEIHGRVPILDGDLVLIDAHLLFGPQSDVTFWRIEHVYGAGDARIINAGDITMHWVVAMTGVRLENRGRLDIGLGFVQVAGTGTVVTDSGTLVLASTGRLKVVGDYERTGGTIESLCVHFDGEPLYSGRVVVTGRAVLDGDIRAVFAGNAEARPRIGDEFILVWAGQRVGEFGSLSHTALTGIAASLAYDPRAAMLVIEPD